MKAGGVRVPVRMLVAVIAASAILAFAGVSAISSVGRVPPSAVGEPTYELSDFSITYPSVDPLTGKKDSETAEIGYRTAWDGSVFPGSADCLLTVQDSKGRVIGEQPVEIEALMPSAVVASVDVSVEGVPASASGSCGSGQRAPADAEYVLSDVRVDVLGPNRVWDAEVRANAAWANGVYPGTQKCIAKLALGDGTTRDVPFTLHVDDGTDIHVAVPPRLQDAESATASCEPYQNPINERP